MGTVISEKYRNSQMPKPPASAMTTNRHDQPAAISTPLGTYVGRLLTSRAYGNGARVIGS
jgi:hypothetical protein